MNLLKTAISMVSTALLLASITLLTMSFFAKEPESKADHLAQYLPQVNAAATASVLFPATQPAAPAALDYLTK